MNDKKKVVLLISILGAFLTPFMGSSINVALPVIAKEFEVNTVLLNWITTAFLLSSAIFVIPFGRAADIFGRKRIYFLGMLLYTLTSILCGISSSVEMLIISRVLQGIGAAMIFGTGMAMLTSAYEPGERGRVLGINVASTYLGLSLGPVLGGFFTQHLGWRSIFLFNAPIGIVIIIIILLKLREDWKESKGEKFDFLGSVIYGIALLGVIGGLSLLSIEWWAPWLLLAGVCAIALFIFVEIKTKNPVLSVNLFRSNRVLTFSSLAALINYSATFAVGYLLSLYLQYVKGLTPQIAGLVLIAQPAVQAVLSPLAGRLSDKIEPQKVASVGMILSVLGLMFFTFIGENTGLILIVSGLILLGAWFALFSSPNSNAIMSSVDKKYYGVTSGILGTARLVGQTFSMGISGLVFALFIGGGHLSREYHPHFVESVHILFLIFTILCIVGIFASLARGKLRT